MDQLPASSPGAPSEPADGDRRQAERRHWDRRKLESISVRGLLAVLLASVALLFSILALLQQAQVRNRLDATRAEQRTLSESAASQRRELVELTERVQSSADRIDELRSLTPQIAELKTALDELRERTESAQRPWVIAEARYLLEIANRRLTLERDVRSALAALQAADERLASLRDPSLNAVRRALALEIQNLRAVPQPDIGGVTVQLASAEQAAAQLPVLGALAEHYEPDQHASGSTPGFARAWQLIKSSLFGMLRIRRIGQDAVELVSLEEQGLRQHHLQLLLYSARLAALRGDEAEFHASVAAARGWLEQMFDAREASVSSLRNELASLETLTISPALPDISRSLKILERVAPRPKGDA